MRFRFVSCQLVKPGHYTSEPKEKSFHSLKAIFSARKNRRERSRTQPNSTIFIIPAIFLRSRCRTGFCVPALEVVVFCEMELVYTGAVLGVEEYFALQCN